MSIIYYIKIWTPRQFGWTRSSFCPYCPYSHIGDICCLLVCFGRTVICFWISCFTCSDETHSMPGVRWFPGHMKLQLSLRSLIFFSVGCWVTTQCLFLLPLVLWVFIFQKIQEIIYFSTFQHNIFFGVVFLNFNYNPIIKNSIQLISSIVLYLDIFVLRYYDWIFHLFQRSSSQALRSLSLSDVVGLTWIRLCRTCLINNLFILKKQSNVFLFVFGISFVDWTNIICFSAFSSLLRHCWPQQHHYYWFKSFLKLEIFMYFCNLLT